MAQTFPLPDSFFAGLPVQQCSFWLPSALHVSRTRGGTVTTARLAERLWTARVTLSQMRHRAFGAIEAQISALAEPGRSLLVRSLPYSGPDHDPGGVLLTGAAPLLHTISADRREIRISGLPAQFVLTPGDYLSFQYGANPTRYALHQVVVGATASGAGLLPLIEVTPPVAVGVTTNLAVDLTAPCFKAVLIPGHPGTSRRVFTAGLTLDLIQSLG